MAVVAVAAVVRGGDGAFDVGVEVAGIAGLAGLGFDSEDHFVGVDGGGSGYV